MPRIPQVHAVASKASITSLWTMAEAEGEVIIRVASRHHAYLIRNKLYAHRAQLRKAAGAVTGIEVSHLDGYKISYWEEELFGEGGNSEPSGKWILRIALDEQVEFELLLADDFAGEIPHFDTNPVKDDEIIGVIDDHEDPYFT